MKFLFNLLKLFPAFQKLLNEFVANENAELKKQAEAWQERFLDMRTAAENYATEAKAAAQVADAYRLNMESALAKIEQRDAEIVGSSFTFLRISCCLISFSFSSNSFTFASTIFSAISAAALSFA